MPIKITMPQLSPTMEAGTLARWLVKEGDDVSSGDILAEIETDKATMEVESIDDGKVGKILVAEGTDEVPVNRVIAVLLEDGEDASALDGIDVGAPEPEASPAAAAPDAPSPAPADDDSRVKASPLARSMARHAGLDLGAIDGTGPHGRVVKRDIEAALAAGGTPVATPAAAEAPRPVAAPALPLPGTSYEEIRVSNMRRVIAERLQEAKQTIPHFYLTVDCEVDRLLAMRKDLNGRSEAYKISVNDFVIRALALALKNVPDANAQWGGDVVCRFATVDIAVAVAVDGGLVTPVVRNAAAKGLAEISGEMKDLAARARDGKLMPEEYQGGGFSLSNLGMYGIRQFDAVINPPQAGILAVGSGEQRPVVRDGALDVATVMSTTLSCDHRVIDGAIGANLLTAFKGYIEDPLTMLL
ncbi:MAG: pyruvate dehydrogenase complex dihydrolipoamide acetyltransferase [Rhodospirillales bacterium]|nr:pyruvate dehydrogenase complex dihydrolipoamide acetyltransferase [Rhodospirillales bacterium]